MKTNLPRGWQPPRALRDFESAVSFNASSPKNLVTIRPNLSPIESAAIKDMQALSRDRVVVFKPTDKTGGLAMLPFEGYDAAMKTILAEKFEEEGEEKPTYPPSSQAKVKKDYNAIVKLLKEGCEKGFFSEKDLAAAIPERPRAGKLYGLPKDHKPIQETTGIPPIRPVVSCCGTALEGLGKIVDHFLRPVDEAAPSFIQDTPALLRKIQELNSAGPQPPGTRLFSLDVIAMYPSIPTSRAPGWVKERCLRWGMNVELADWLTRATEVMLAGNSFEYDGELYGQLTGTSIGAPFACGYSGCAMARVEEEGQRRWRGKGGGARREVRGQEWRLGDDAEVDWWSRFRDDCLGLWRGTEAEFQGFVKAMNSVDKNIKFTSEINWQDNMVVFLDLTITIDHLGFLHTDLYTKPNAKNSLLLPSSCHRPTVTRSSVYSLALRIRRICSTEEAAEKQFQKLAERLRERQYSEAVISAGIARAKAVTREEALRRVVRRKEEGSRQHRLIVEYDRRSSPALAAVLENNYQQMVARDQRLGRIFPNKPKPAFRRGKNIKELLCKAKLPPVRRIATRAREEEARSGLSRCNKGLGRNGCSACPFITLRPNQVIRSVKIHTTGQEVQVEGRITCKTGGGYLYLLWSKKAPAKQYLGSSSREPRMRLGEHRRDVAGGRVDKAVAKHFSDTNSREEDLVFVPFKRVRSSNILVLRHLETLFINNYNLVEAGINRILS